MNRIYRVAAGNLWTFPATYRVITTNGILKSNGAAVMGAGVARQARDRYPGLDSTLGKLIKEGGNHVYRLPHNLISFPTKQDWRNPSDMRLIVQSAMEIMELLATEPDITVAMTRPGCGNGGLDWNVVGMILCPLLDSRFVILTGGR